MMAATTTVRRVAPALGLVLLLSSLLAGLAACDKLAAVLAGHGTRLEFNSGELYYTKRVDEATAKRLGEYLVKESFYDGTPKTAQLDKADGTWKFRMVVKAGMDQDEDYINVVKLFGMEVANNVFNGEKLSVELCDEQLKTLRTVQPLDGKRLEFNGGELYYASMVDKADADKLGKHLATTGFYDGKKKTLHLKKDDKTWIVRIVVKQGLHEQEQAVREFRVMGLELSGHVFDGAPVTVHLCDEKLVTLKEVECLDGKRLVFKGGELYYAQPVDEAQARKLGNYLVEDGFFDGTPKTVRLVKKDSVWQFQMVIKAGMEQNAEFLALAKQVVGQLSEKVFGGATVELHLCDATLTTLHVVTK